MDPVLTKFSARLGMIEWMGKEMLVISEETHLQESLDKLVKLKNDFTVVDILMLGLSEGLEIRQRLKSDGVEVYTVDIRKTSWSTMEEALEEVAMNKWRIGSVAVHDEVAMGIMQSVEEGLEYYELQVLNYRVAVKWSDKALGALFVLYDLHVNISGWNGEVP